MSRASYCVPGCPGTSQDILTRGMQSQLGYPGISQDIPVNCCISKQSHVQGILLCSRMSWNIPGHPNKRYIYTPSYDIQGYPRTSQSTAVYPNNPMSRASYCVPGCPGTSQDILTRGMQSQLGHPGISQDIPVNCCISKQSHVQGILLCPWMSGDVPGHPNKRYAVSARTSGDIPGHPSQLLYIQTIPCPGHPIVSQDVPGHPNKRYMHTSS